MLPAVVSREIEEGIKSFLRTTFPPSSPAFQDTLENFLGEPGLVFKGPYYSLKLPFRPAPARALPLREVAFPYPPHLHQARAMERLAGENPKSTLVATGTGSGKTECFLYPVLDHCAVHAGERGIKAVVIYPMNALATDQAKRFAEAIFADPKLRGKVRAGLFIGDEGDSAGEMSPSWVITSKGQMREQPPDILLTNYKMLDYLLLRPTEQELWRFNAPETLRFLVVDELHTFDGAQATDLACLARRLKARLRVPAEHLVCVGTSATLGSETQHLVEYAAKVFGESFEANCVIGEDLLTLGDVVEGCFIKHHRVPAPEELEPRAEDAVAGTDAYLRRQHALWFGKEEAVGTADERLALGLRLREHAFFRNLLTLAEKSGRKILAEDWIAHGLVQMLGGELSRKAAQRVMDSFLSLCAIARFPQGGRPVPLLRVHVHLWARELARLVATVEAKPQLAFSDDLGEEGGTKHLPVVHCRECGMMGWGGTMRANAEKVNPELKEYYKAFFGASPTLRFFFPIGEGCGGNDQTEFPYTLCGHCLGVNPADAPKCGHCRTDEPNLVRVSMFDRVRRTVERTEGDTSCPYCSSRTGLTIVGSRSASLTSVALSQLYTSPFNSEKKALAFSDNVQDASHRAGFFAARTYRVNLRTAIMRALIERGGEPNLAELGAGFADFWRRTLGETDFVGVFLAPDMEWMDDYEQLRREGKLPTGSTLPVLVQRRSNWEITAEFGFRSRLGRTLEKSRAAMAHVDPVRLGAASQRLLESLREKAGGFGGVDGLDISRFLAGVIHRLRTSGGIYHPELDAYVGDGGNSFLLNRSDHMPGFGPKGELPVFFTMGPERLGRFEKLVAGGTNLSWCQRWAVSALKSVPGLTAESAAIVVELGVDALTRAGVLQEREVRGNRVWGLPREQMRVTTKMGLMRCKRCGHGTSCVDAERAIWDGAPCLRIVCGGTYGAEARRDDYYGDLYRRGDVVRIRSSEHTGLLKRPEREWIERRFMAAGKDRGATDPNLLSCTPTLEMGVNIGDLASVVLCSVPPGTANYVQRVGRAGRKEGAAVSLTIVSGKPHDLYFFELPEDMMAGEIRPPGTFLNAPAVLERQLTAYCMDRWAEQTVPKPILPPLLEPVLDAVQQEEKDESRFPYDFFHFVEVNLKGLVDGFLGLFRAEELPEDSRRVLSAFARGGEGSEGLDMKILKRLIRLLEERTDLRARMLKVGRAIKKNREATARDEALDGELEELKQQRDGLQSMLKEINSKRTLEFLTDEGLLPNYAFPEEGVELRSIILKKRRLADGEKGKFEALTFEYVRPGSAAITELAPGSSFYVEGRRVKVDQIGLGVGKPERWHFCDACAYMEPISDASVKHTECPACESPNWADASLIRELVRLRQVVATTTDRKSRSHDEKDERDRNFFSRHESVVIPPDATRESYQIAGGALPFGFEFLGKLSFRVVNLGVDSPEIQAFRLGGREIAAGGFAMCPECGKVQGARSARGEDEMKHDLSCRFRGKDAAPLQAVFLYRELHSEALRILLPSTSANADAEMASFVAAVLLGLRLYFKGGIDHLKGCVDEEPVKGTSLRRKFLVLYDQVPGGTGYLKELAQKPKTFMEVLRRALTHLRACECQTRSDHGTDGCHRCVLQTQQRSDYERLSRTTAIRLLDAILENEDRLERVSRVSEIDIHPLIKSELEKSFLDSLRSVAGAQMQPKIVNGSPGYLWRCGEAAWEISLQVPVGANSGVSVPSIPDFVFYPVRVGASRPLAIFLDGFAFHADEAAGRNRIAKDVQQRHAVIRSGKFWVWSFSWEDIQFRADPVKIPITTLGERPGDRWNIVASGLLKTEELGLAKAVSGFSSWGLFLEYLQRPNEVFWRAIGQLYAMHMPTVLRRVSSPSARNAVETLATQLEKGTKIQEGGEPDLVGSEYTEGRVAGVVVLNENGTSRRQAGGVFHAMRFDDERDLLTPEFAKEWRGFLRLLNRVQFLPHFHVCTIRGCKAGLFAGMLDAFNYFCAGGAEFRSGTDAATEREESAHPNVEFVVPVLRPFINALIAKNLPFPEVGFELESSGLIAGMAELAWPEQKMAVIPQGAEDWGAFADANWVTFPFNESGVSATDAESIFKKLETRT